MFRIKKLYSFVLWTFLPLLLATFSVCLFILLMQWLWKYVDELVGKGVELKVLAELFFYAANQLVPMALPITVLLSSLMTFGSLGENLELLAMKSAGISLLKIMKPLIFLVIIISGIAFLFQNNVLPGAQTKLITILVSIRQKNPELDIPEKSFYTIPETGYNIRIQNKTKTGLLEGVTIYDYSNGSDNVVIMVSDSGRMKVSDDKMYLILTLYNGESYQNQNQSRGRSRLRSSQSQVQTPFLRQTFSIREILIEFDSNFNLADDSFVKNRDISKKIPELRSFIRETSILEDSLKKVVRSTFVDQAYTFTFKQKKAMLGTNPLHEDSLSFTNFELLYKNLPANKKLQILEDAKNKIDRAPVDYNSQVIQQIDWQKSIRGHKIELQKKFTYSLACLLFFFIGAPLGAIIRKGGLALPAVLSVFIFIVYYLIDTFGIKMAKQDSWHVWAGLWLSAATLALLGMFLTYKAVNDSVIMNIDVWKDVLQRLVGKREIRNYSRKEVIMNVPDYPEAIRLIERWNVDANLYLGQKQKTPFYISFWKQDFNNLKLNSLSTVMNQWIDDLLNSKENLIIGKLMDYPIIAPYNLNIFNQPAIRWTCSILFPVGILIYIICLQKQKQINNDLLMTMKVNEEICNELKNLKLDCISGK